MDSERLSVFIPLLQTGFWGILILVIVILFRKEVREFFNRFTKSDEVQMSLGALTVQAKTMRELQRSIDIGLPEDKIDRSEIEALIETKIKSVQAAMERTISRNDVREDPRIEINQPIEIKGENGNTVGGIALDVSEAGIGFKSNERLHFNEIVEIYFKDTQHKVLPSILDHVKIVRIEQVKEGYNYGAAVMES